MDPSSSIAIIERDLRRLVEHQLGNALGTDWLHHAFDPVVTQKLQQRQREEAGRRAPASVPSSLLEYTHLYELRRVIERRWEQFSAPLGKLAEFRVLMDQVGDYRNAPAHSRELLPYERSLLEGIAGLIRTKVTVFMSSQASDGQFYPRLEWARDEFGNEPNVAPAMAVLRANERLAPGRRVQFEARAWDPQGRDIEWSVIVSPGPGLGVVAVGTDVTFTIDFVEENVSEETCVHIYMASVGRFHRRGRFDDSVTFIYSIDPPLEP